MSKSPTTKTADARRTLYLHGRGSSPTDPPGDLVGEIDSPYTLYAPHLDGNWFAHPARGEAQVDGWLDDTALAIGHSYGGWMLLCAAHSRLSRGASCPRILLLSSVLGPGAAGGRGFIPYRTRAIGEALGIRGSDPQPIFPADRLSFVHAEDDEQCPVAPLHTLKKWFTVEIVPGGHRLDHPVARDVVRSVMHDCRRAVEKTWQE